jgi:hypothetical protein
VAAPRKLPKMKRPRERAPANLFTKTPTHLLASRRGRSGGKVGTVARKNIKAGDAQIDPIKLNLDFKNPRFAAYHRRGRRKEKEIVSHLLENDDLRELIESIAANGYVDLEPVIVVEEDAELIVVEGNRRIAALKLFRGAIDAADLGVKLPPIAADLEDSLHEVTYRRVKDRDEARQYIGFKHINGPHKWDAFAKGRFAADWYIAERSNGLTLRDIAHRLGDRHDTIIRLVNGIFVLEQAQKSKLFDIEDRPPGRPFFFSHLYVALTRTPYRDYLGMDDKWRQNDPSPHPVPSKSLPRLRQVLIWLYGSAEQEVEPIVRSQNPHVKQLGEVLSNPIALKRLEASNDLAKAFSEVESREKRFEDALIRAVKYAEDAQTLVDVYDGDPALLEYANRLGKIGQTLSRTMKEVEGPSESAQ